MNKSIAKSWMFESSSSSKEYETLQYEDGSTSCNCPGWTRRVAPDGSRSCKHTRAVDMGRADAQCVASHDYNNDGQKLGPAPLPAKKASTKAKKAKEESKPKGAVVRKIVW